MPVAVTEQEIGRRLGPEVREGVGRLVQATEAARLVRLAEERGVTAVLLKGAAVAEQAWGGAERRESTDVDLWVRPADFTTFRTMVESEGYRCLKRISPLLAANWSAFARFLPTEILFDHPGTGLQLDVHLSLSHADMAPVVDGVLAWERQVPVAIPGGEVPTTGPVDTVLYLALHGLKHGWGKRSQIEDFAAFCRERVGAAEWGQVLAEARERGCMRMVLLAAAVAALERGAVFPDEVTLAIKRDRAVRPVARRLVADLDAGRSHEGLGLAGLALRRWAWDTLGGRLAWAARLLFVPNIQDLEWVPLPPRLAPAYWLIRPVRLAWWWVVRRNPAR